MPNIQSSNRKQFLIAGEGGSYGADGCAAKLTTATANLIYQDFEAGAELTNILTPITVDRARGSASGVAMPAPVKDRCELNAVCALTGGKGGALPDPEAPHYAELLKACGFKEVITGGVATYTPDTKAAGSLTCYQWTHDLNSEEARLEWGTGIRCNAVFRFALNTEAKVEVTGQGIYGNTDQISDGAAYFSPTDGKLALQKDGVTSVPARTGSGVELYAIGPILVCSAMTLTAEGAALCLSALEIDMGWTLDVKACMGAASNLREVFLTRAGDAKVSGSFDLTDDDATFDAIKAAMLSGAELALVIVLVSGDGGTGEAKLTVTLPKIQIGLMTKGANGNVRTHTVPFTANGDWTSLKADNDISLAYSVVA